MRSPPMQSHVRSAWRSLRQSPISAGVAIATLGLTLGIGAAIVAVVDQAVFASPPFADIDSLSIVGQVPAAAPASAPRPVSALTLTAWREVVGAVAQLEAYDPTNVTITGNGHPYRVSATVATPSLLSLLGVAPKMGRHFSPDDQRVVLIADQLGRQLFGNTNPLGESLIINGEPHEVIGVLPAAFSFPLNVSDLWMPLAPSDDDGRRLRVVARIGPDATNSALVNTLGAPRTASADTLLTAVVPMRTALRHPAATAFPLLLLGAAVATLLTAINVGGMLLLRMLERASEYEVRVALGAQWRHLTMHTAVEAHIIVGCGIVCGLLIALWTTPFAGQVVATYLGAATAPFEISWTAVAVLAGVGLACAWVAAVIPIMSATRFTRANVSRRGATAASPSALLVRRVFAVTEIALAFVLVAATLLVMRSVTHILRIDSGLAFADTLTARLSLPREAYPEAEDVVRFYETLHQDLSAQLGPQPIAIVDELPLTGDGGRIALRAGRRTMSHDGIARVVSPKYFGTIGIRMLDGRDFTPGDDRRAPLRVIVSASFARAVFHSMNVVGRDLLVGASDEPAEIIGVVSEVKHRSLDEADIPTIYFSMAQRPSRSVHVVTRPSSGADRRDLIEVLRSAVASHDPHLPLYAVRSVQDVIDTSPGVPLRQVVSIVLMVFGVLAMVIAAIGVFGVLADDVSRRRVEFAVRVALGADPRRVRGHVVAQAVGLLTPALVSGLLLSSALSPALRPLLFQVSAADGPTLALVGATMAIVTVVAAIVPATRAARTRPGILLKGL